MELLLLLLLLLLWDRARFSSWPLVWRHHKTGLGCQYGRRRVLGRGEGRALLLLLLLLHLSELWRHLRGHLRWQLAYLRHLGHHIERFAVSEDCGDRGNVVEQRLVSRRKRRPEGVGWK